MLHNKVLSVLKHERPERPQNGNRRMLECRRTPIHIIATSNPRLPSIELGRRILPKKHFQGSAEQQTANGLDNLPSSSIDLQSTSGINGTECSNPRKRKRSHPESPSPMNLASMSARNELMPFPPEPSEEVNDDYRVPRVIISLALESHQTLSSDSCQKWLASCPTLVKFAKVEAVYKGFSVLLILTIPISIWDLLPEDPACCFIGFATSQNLLRCRPQTLESILESSPLTNQIPSDSFDFTPQDDKLIKPLKVEEALMWEQIHMNQKPTAPSGSWETHGGSDIMKPAALHYYPSWSPEATAEEPWFGAPTDFLSKASSHDVIISNTEEATILNSMGAEGLTKDSAVPYQDNRSTFNATRRQGPYLDQGLREITASAPKFKACIRCRMQRIRVSAQSSSKMTPESKHHSAK